MKKGKTAAMLILSEIHVRPVREGEMVTHSRQKHLDGDQEVLFPEIKNVNKRIRI
jgi:hypothetical protein